MPKANKAAANAAAATAAVLDDVLATKAEVAASHVAIDLAKIDWKNLKRHPLSEKYGPPLNEEEMLGLATDIEQNGQHEAIKLYEGQVLAGWNRYQATRQKNIKPRLEEYTGDKPEAVAFGTNVIRRRLSSVAKAFMGAQFYIATGAKQADIAKQCAVSLNRLNQCAQLIRLDTDESRRACAALRGNPEVTSGAFEEMLAENGIVRSAPRTASAVSAVKGGASLDDGLGEDDDLDDLDDDLTGGAIDGLTDPDDEDDLEETKPGKRREIGEGAAPLPAAGSRVGSTATRPEETLVSKLAKHFKSLPPADKVSFVSFAWLAGGLNGAVTEAVRSGKVKFEMPTDAPVKKAKGSEYKKQAEAAAPEKEKKPASPAQVAAREKFAAASKEKAAAKKAVVPAKKAAAKK